MQYDLTDGFVYDKRQTPEAGGQRYHAGAEREPADLSPKGSSVGSGTRRRLAREVQ